MPPYNQSGDNTAYANVIKVPLTLDTSAYASGDQMLDAAVKIPAAGRIGFGRAALHSLEVIDGANQKVEIDFYIFDANPAQYFSSTKNQAFAISKAGLLACYCSRVNIIASNYVTISGSAAFATGSVPGTGKTIQTLNKEGDLWCMPVIRSAATYGQSDMTLLFGFLND